MVAMFASETGTTLTAELGNGKVERKWMIYVSE
jgi:hypothetical protein